MVTDLQAPQVSERLGRGGAASPPRIILEVQAVSAFPWFLMIQYIF